MKFLFSFMLVCLSILIEAQENYISGFVFDATTQERVTNVIVFDSVSENSYTTNEYGYFCLPAKLDSLNSEVLFTLKSPNYETIKLKRNQYSDTCFVFNLVPTKTLMTSDLANYFEQNYADQSAISMLPVVDKNLIYNVKSFLNLNPSFNGSSIASFDNYSKELPARVNGVTEETTEFYFKTGNKKQSNINAELGTTDLNFFAESPLLENKASYILTARKSLDAIWLPALLEKSTDLKDKISFDNYDFNSQVDIRYSKDASLKFGILGMKNSFGLDVDFDNHNRYKTDLEWSNLLTNFSWTYKFFENVFGDFALSYYTHTIISNDKINYNNLKSDFDKQTQLNKFNLNLDFDYYRDQHYIRFGLLYNFNKYNLEKTIYNNKYSSTSKTQENEYNSHLISLYAEDNYNILHFINFNLGMRFSTYFYENGGVYSSMQPRFSLNLNFTEDLSAYASFYQTNSYTVPVTKLNPYSPIQNMVLTNKEIKPEKSLQFNLGLKYHLISNIKFSAAFCYQRLNNVPMQYGNSALVNPLNSQFELNSNIEQADGKAFKYKVNIERENENFCWDIKYTFFNLTYNNEGDELIFENINSGKQFKSYLPKHNIVSAAKYVFNEYLDFKLSHSYNSGYFTSSISGAVPTNSGDLGYYQKNAYNLNSFNRFDVEAVMKMNIYSYPAQVCFKVYNVLNRQNTEYMIPNLDKNNSVIEYSMVPFLPTINLKVNL